MALVGLGLHAWRNGRAWLGHLRTPLQWVLIGAAGLAAVAFFAVEGQEGGGGGPRALFGAVETAPIRALAPVLGVESAALVAHLRAGGYTVAGDGSSLAEVAQASGRAPHNAVEHALLAIPPAARH